MKQIAKYYNLYSVTKDGRVYSERSKIFLSPASDHKGYHRVHISTKRVDGKDRTEKVHRLVAKAFIPNPDNLPQVNHKNGIKTDNRVDNLEWVTTAQNVHHAIKNGTKKDSKLSMEIAEEIRQLYKDGKSIKELALMYGVVKTNITNIVKNRIWKT